MVTGCIKQYALLGQYAQSRGIKLGSVGVVMSVDTEAVKLGASSHFYEIRWEDDTLPDTIRWPDGIFEPAFQKLRHALVS